MKETLLSWLRSIPLFIKVILVVLVTIGVWWGYRSYASDSSSEVTYQTTEVKRGNLTSAITSAGQVSTANTASVTTQATGVVKKVSATNGQTIQSGQVIAEIELDLVSKQKYAQASASYQSAKNSLESAKNQLNTLQSKMFAANQKLINDAVARDLATGDPTRIQQNADWLASENDYKNQQQVIAQAQTAVNSAWLSYQQASPLIYAPISGEVTGLSLQVGSVISSSIDTTQKVATIKTTAPATVTVNLTEIDISDVQLDDTATLTFDAFSDQTFTGKVVSIDTAGSVSSGVTTYPVVIKLDTETTTLLANMSAQVTIVTDVQESVLIVPSSAIQTQNGKTSVKVMKNGQPASIAVEAGHASDTEVEVKSGISEGETVVTGQSSTAKTTTTTGTTSVFSGLGGNRGGASGGNAVRMNVAR